MIDLAERQHVNSMRAPTSRGDTLVIDNGVYELRAGALGDMCIAVRNRVYRNRERVSFDPFPLATMKSMFDGDVVMGMDTLESTLDLVLGHVQPERLDTLIITDTPCSPTAPELLDTLFSVYRFNTVQIGFDFGYAYHRYFDGADCLVVAMKYSSLVVAYICGGRIDCVYKVGFGGRELLEYINYIMVDKYKEFRKDYRNLVARVRLAGDYDREAREIYAQMCAGDYRRTLFLTEPSAQQEDRVAKKYKKAPSSSLALPAIDYWLLDADEAALSAEDAKEKKRQKMLYFGTLHRLKTRMQKALAGFDEMIDGLRDALEKHTNLDAYLARKKARFAALVREQELRDKLRRDARDRRTRECQIRNKEGALDAEEQRIRDSIADAEDPALEERLAQCLDLLSAEILELDPDFIPFYANTVEILRGDNIGRQCVNIELIKWPEIFFHPSIIGSDQMGLAEVLAHIGAKHRVENVLVCGGFSFIPNLEGRIRDALAVSVAGRDLRVVLSQDAEGDAFYGAQLSPLFPVFTREEYAAVGAEELLRRSGFYGDSAATSGDARS
ncbi:actin-related protein 5 [Pancytospora philotis]|nr:actin-related protein 5 [Pancytospora philotis]